MFLSFSFYSEDEVGHCIIVLSTLINREPSLCAPLLPEILLTVTRVIRETQYSWELDSNIYVPQNSRSIAKQFIRCALHQLSGNIISWVKVRFEKYLFIQSTYVISISLCQILIGNGIFSMLFLMELQEEQRTKFFGTLVNCLLDFTELSPAAPVASFLQVTKYCLLSHQKISFYICSMF